MADNLGTSVLTLSTDSAKFDKGMDSAKAKMEKLGGAMKKVGVGITAIGAGFALLATNILEEADKIGKASLAIGIDVERLQGYIHGAGIASGISSDAMIKAVTTLSKNIVDAAEGGKSMSKIFKGMGIEVRTSSGRIKSADKVFLELAKHLKTAGNETKTMGDMSVLLGGKMVNLKNFLRLGADGVERLIDEAKKFGVMSREQVAAAEKFNDAMARLAMAFKGLLFTF